MKQTKGEKVFGVVNIFLMLLLCVITLYPLWYVAVASISDAMAVSTGAVTLWPVGLELASYRKVLGMENIWTAYGNTIFYSTAGTMINLALTILGAYPLSKKRLKGRRIITFFILATMWFSAGMMPTFLNFRNLHLNNTRMGILLCYAINTFNVILMRTFFENVPESLEEVAKIDGAGDGTILTHIYLPLSVPAIATITMYYFVDRWNGWFWSMLLLNDPNKLPLQVLLKKLIVETTFNINEGTDLSATVMTEQTVVYATIMVAVIPMLILYPFIQKYFVKGIMVGAIKG